MLPTQATHLEAAEGAGSEAAAGAGTGAGWGAGWVGDLHGDGAKQVDKAKNSGARLRRVLKNNTDSFWKSE